MITLQTELHTYSILKSELLKNHEGRFAVIVGHRLVGIRDNWKDAYKLGLKECGNVEMLVRRISIRGEFADAIDLKEGVTWQSKASR